VHRLYLALSLLLAPFLGSAQGPPSPPEAAFHTLIGVLRNPDVNRWYAMYPADPEVMSKAGLRGGGRRVSDMIAEGPEDTARVAGLYRKDLLEQLFNSLWTAFGKGRDLRGLSLTDIVWSAPRAMNYGLDTAARYHFKGHGLLRSGQGAAVYIVGASIAVTPDGQVLHAAIDNIVPGGDMAAYTRYADSVRKASPGMGIAGPTVEEMEARGKEVRIIYQGACGADSIRLTERYLWHPDGFRYLLSTTYVTRGDIHQLINTNGPESITWFGYHAFQLEEPFKDRYWCVLRKEGRIMGFVVTGNYLPVCKVTLRDVAQ
jgi:hypothetical protein